MAIGAEATASIAVGGYCFSNINGDAGPLGKSATNPLICPYSELIYGPEAEALMVVSDATLNADTNYILSTSGNVPESMRRFLNAVNGQVTWTDVTADALITVDLASMIINELPGLILAFLHVAPDILAFYPAPLKYIPDPDKEVRYQVLQSIAAQKAASFFDAIMGEEQKKDNVVNFGDAYRFTEDERYLVMGRRNSGSSYPEEAKDQEEYAFYEANGFEEVGDSRLLYKYVRRC